VPLVDHFRKQFCDRHAKQVESISAVVMRQLYAHAWPGNIRQLKNAIESMVVLDTDGVLNGDDLPPDFVSSEDVEIPIIAGPSELIGQSLSNIERWAYQETLKLTDGNREEAARILGIGARTVYRKLKEFDL
jgi:two-component system response regulator HydG